MVYSIISTGNFAPEAHHELLFTDRTVGRKQFAENTAQTSALHEYFLFFYSDTGTFSFLLTITGHSYIILLILLTFSALLILLTFKLHSQGLGFNLSNFTKYPGISI